MKIATVSKLYANFISHQEEFHDICSAEKVINAKIFLTVILQHEIWSLSMHKKITHMRVFHYENKEMLLLINEKQTDSDRPTAGIYDFILHVNKPDFWYDPITYKIQPKLHIKIPLLGSYKHCLLHAPVKFRQ